MPRASQGCRPLLCREDAAAPFSSPRTPRTQRPGNSTDQEAVLQDQPDKRDVRRCQPHDSVQPARVRHHHLVQAHTMKVT